MCDGAIHDAKMLSVPFYDDYRYLNFTSAAVNTGGHFNTRDGIYT